MMTHARLPRRRKLLVALAALMLTGSVSAGSAAPLAAAPGSVAEATLHRRDTFYSDATYTVQVGQGYAGCEGEYWMSWGVKSPYMKHQFLNPCP